MPGKSAVSIKKRVFTTGSTHRRASLAPLDKLGAGRVSQGKSQFLGKSVIFEKPECGMY